MTSPALSSARLARLAQALLIAALGCGVFAFGAVYPWAYWPLAAACLIVGLTGVFLDCPPASGASRGLMVSLAFFACAALLQVVPLPPVLLSVVSPSSRAVIESLHPAVRTGIVDNHPLSIQPSLTWTAIVLFGSFALMLVGSSRLFSVVGASGFINRLTWLGVIMALVGIIQNALSNGHVYGFWVTSMGGNPFGPFVNRNHFAGWMMLALPLTTGLLCARLNRAMRHVSPNWRDRLLWFSSPQASQLLLLMATVMIMALALALAMSRAGIGGLVIVLLLLSAFALRRGQRSHARTALVAYALLVVVVAVGAVGADAIVARFQPAPETGWLDRGNVWADAWGVAKLFPLAGTGLNTYGVTMLFFQTFNTSVHYAQAHNDYLQLLAEGGALLAIPAAAILAFFIRDVRRRFSEDRGSSAYWIRVGAVTGLIAIALQEAVDFSLQMPANAALFAAICGIALHKTPARHR